MVLESGFRPAQFYHITDFFDVKRYIQNETAREGGNLMWDKLVDEAKHQESFGKEYARFRRENGGSSTPSYEYPALAIDAVSRGYKKPQQRSRTPSGGKGQPKQCDWCGKHNGCKGEKGTCPTWDKECGICHGWNHYKAVCRKAAQMPGARGGTQQKMGKGSKPFSGKAKAKYNAHSVVLKMVLSAEGKLPDTDKATVQNAVTSEASGPLSKAAKWDNLVLSGSKQSKAALQNTHNVFSCDSIHDTGDSSLDQYQTDTDPSGRLCIMTDILVRAKTTFQTSGLK